jgi:hypothetical protein
LIDPLVRQQLLQWQPFGLDRAERWRPSLQLVPGFAAIAEYEVFLSVFQCDVSFCAHFFVSQGHDEPDSKLMLDVLDQVVETALFCSKYSHVSQSLVTLASLVACSFDPMSTRQTQRLQSTLAADFGLAVRPRLFYFIRFFEA